MQALPADDLPPAEIPAILEIQQETPAIKTDSADASKEPEKAQNLQPLIEFYTPKKPTVDSSDNFVTISEDLGHKTTSNRKLEFPGPRPVLPKPQESNQQFGR